MKILKIEIENCLSFKKISIPEKNIFSNVNLFIGKNDSGKSNLLKLLDIIFNGCDSEYIKDCVGNKRGYCNFGMNALGKTLIHNMGDVGKIIVYYSDFSKYELDSIYSLFKDNISSIFFRPFPGSISSPINKPQPNGLTNSNYKDVSIEYIINYEDETNGSFTIKTIRLGNLNENEWIEGSIFSSSDNSDQKKLFDIIQKSNYKIIPAIREVKSEVQNNNIDNKYEIKLNGEGLPNIIYGYQMKPLLGKRPFLTRLINTLSIYNEVKNVTSAINQNITDIEYDRISQKFMGDAIKQLTVIHFLLHSLDSKILGIEEPESHLHPERQKKLLDYLNNFSEETNKQLFITTHSPFFIDNSNINNIYVFNKKGDSIITKEVVKEEDVYDIISLLGIQPHDILQNDLILFVEGLSEKYVFENFARKIYPDFNKRFIIFFPINGISQISDVEILEKMRTNYYLILCSHIGNPDGEEKIEKLKRIMTEANLQDKFKILNKREIENYISTKYIEKEFNIKITTEIKKDMNMIELVKSSGSHYSWESKKVAINRKLSDLMTVEEIDPEITDLFRKIIG